MLKKRNKPLSKKAVEIELPLMAGEAEAAINETPVSDAEATTPDKLIELLSQLDITEEELKEAGINIEGLNSILNLPWYSRLLRWLVSDKTTEKAILSLFLSEKHIYSKTECEDDQLEQAEKSEAAQESEKLTEASEEIKAAKKSCLHALKNYFTSRVWPQANTMLISSINALRKAFMITGFVDGVEIVITRVWSTFLLSFILIALYYYFEYPDQHYGNTLENILFDQSENEVGLASALTLPTVWPALLALPVVCGIINGLLRIRHAKVLDEKKYQELVTALQTYSSKGWKDCGLWCLPWHKVQAMLHQARLTLLWDGRITREQRQTLFKSVQHIAHTDTKLTQLHAISILSELADFPRTGDLTRLHRLNFDAETLKDLLRIKTEAFEDLKQFASQYQPHDISHKSINCLYRGIKPLMRFVYANYSLWSLGKPQSKAFQPLFWLYKLFIFYIKARLAWTIGKGMHIMIERYINKRDCEKAGRKWVFMRRVWEEKCTYCGDYQDWIFYDDVFENEDCIKSWLAYPRTEKQLIKSIHDFDFDAMPTLDFSEQFLSDTGLANVLDALKPHVSHLQELYLNASYGGAAPLGIQAAQSIADIIASADLKKLDLSSLQIGDEEIQIVLQNLSKLSRLISLDLTGNLIGPEGARSIAEILPNMTALQTFKLINNTIGKEGAKFIAQNLPYMPSLQFFDLWGNLIGPEGAELIALALPKMPSFQSLGLRNNSIGDKGAEAITHALLSVPSLQGLDLGSNFIGDTGAEAVAEILANTPDLQLLNLWFNLIGDTGAKAIAQAITKAKSLQLLGLGGNLIGAKGAKSIAEALANTSSLQILYLGANSLGDAGAEFFAEMLPFAHSLQLLELGANAITKEGASDIAQALSHTTTLQALNLWGNSIKDEGAAAFAEVLDSTSLRSLDLWGNSIGDQGVQDIAQALSRGSKLLSLDLGSNLIGVKGAESLAQLFYSGTTLQSLYLGVNTIGDKGAIAIAQALHRASSLQTLYLKANAISDEGAKVLAKEFPHAHSLHEVELRNNLIGKSGADAIAEHLTTYKPPRHRLWIYSFNNADEKSAIRDVSSDTALTFLDLADNKMPASSAEKICKVLPNTHIPVSKLDLSGNAFYDTKLEHCAADAAELKLPWPVRIIWQASKSAFHAFKCLIGKKEYDSRISIIEIEGAEPSKIEQDDTDKEILTFALPEFLSTATKRSSSSAKITEQLGLSTYSQPLCFPFPSSTHVSKNITTFEDRIALSKKEEASSHQIVEKVQAQAASTEIIVAWYILYKTVEPAVTKTVNTILSFFFKPKQTEVPLPEKNQKEPDRPTSARSSASFFAESSPAKPKKRRRRRRTHIPEETISVEEMAKVYLQYQQAKMQLSH